MVRMDSLIDRALNLCTPAAKLFSVNVSRWNTLAPVNRKMALEQRNSRKTDKKCN